MDLTESRVLARGKFVSRRVVKAIDAIPPIVGLYNPEFVKKKLEEEHEIWHPGQQWDDKRCPLCQADPRFDKREAAGQ
jgi:hypothetical protein